MVAGGAVVTKIRVTHWLVRATCMALGLGAVLGIIIGIDALGSPTTSPVLGTITVLIYLAIGAAAVGLWFGEELGLRATRVLLIAQVPIVQSTSFSYLFYTGASFLIYVGSEFGLNGFIGSAYVLQVHPHGTSSAGYLVGVNLLAIAMLTILSRVDLMPFSSSPPPPFK